MIWWTVFVFVLWVAFNWFAPWSVVMKSSPLMTTRLTVARLPGHILYQANVERVRFYRGKLQPRGFAFTAWSWPYQIVVMDDEFLKQAPADLIHFTLAHELGHCALGHTFKKWLGTVLLVGFIPVVRVWLMRDEHTADEYAERLSGVSRSVLRGRPQSDHRGFISPERSKPCPSTKASPKQEKL